MQNPRELISEKIKWIIGEIGVSDIEPEVTLVMEQKFGDLATNIAMVLSKRLQKNPRDLSEEIVLKLQEDQDVNEVFEKIEVAGPGFINFFLSSKYLSKMLQEIIQKDSWQERLKTKSPQRVMVEFGDPNPFKEIHIGHLRNFCIGESFSRLLESQGDTVIRANYQGDVGLHVAKALFGLMADDKWQMANDKSNKEKSKILADAYAFGAKKFEEDEEAKKEIIEINKKIYEEDESLKKLWEEGRKVSLDHFEEMYKRIGFSYNKYYFESVTAKKGKEVVRAHIEDGVFEESDGAIIYRGENDGLHTRVFLTSQDYATYEGKDLALAIIKEEEENPDISYILTGSEQLDYFQVMLSALRKIKPEVAEKTKHYTFGHVRLKEGKMSSRTGDVITASWLLDEAVRRVREQFSDMDDETSEKVGVGAVKYSMLKFGIASDIHFDFTESISLEGNSAPYLQYAYVRTQSVLGKAKQVESEKLKVESLEKEESELLRYLAQYSYNLEMASKEFAPNLLCNYLFELSQKFNLFYQKQKIIGSENEEFRLRLTKAVGIVLKNGLKTLGIATVEKM